MSTHAEAAGENVEDDLLRPRRYRSRRGVERAGRGWLRKKVDFDANLEVAKAKAMRAALEGTVYRAPDARPGDRPGTIFVEDLGVLTPVVAIAETAQPDELRRAAEHAGRILALLHERLGAAFDSESLARATQARHPFRGTTLLHCDYAPMNVFRDTSGTWVTLDGSPSITTNSPIARGKPVTDLVQFTVLLCWPLRPLHWRVAQIRGRLTARRAFVRAYHATSGTTIRLFPYEAIFFLQYIWTRKILRRING